MKIRVIKCSNPGFWYSNKVGQVFNVVNEPSVDWYIKTDSDFIGSFILKVDSEVVTEGVKEAEESRETADSALDIQIGGNWYKNHKMQPMEIAYDYELSPALVHCLSYILRYKSKNGKQDLEKAVHCLQLAIELEYAE